MGEGREGRFTLDKPPSLGAAGSKSDRTGRPRVGLEKRCGERLGEECAALSSLLGSQHMIQTEIAQQRLLFRNSCSLEISCYLVTWR